MTLFEFIGVAFSIVLSLAAVRLLGGLSVAFIPDRRYWPHAAWILLILLNSAMVWWNFWSFRNLEWNLAFFFLVLVVPALIYLQAAALVPENPETVQAWRAHFFAARSRFFFTLASFFLLIASLSWFLLDFPLMHPARVLQGLGFALALTGAFSSHRRVHEALPIIFLVLFSIASGTLFLEPASMASRP